MLSDFLEEHKKTIYTVGVILFAVAILVMGIVYKATHFETVPVVNDKETQIPGEEITVHIKGGVKEPGLYTLLKGARIADAVDAAGGVGVNTDSLSEVNLAEVLSDGQEIIIPGEYFEKAVNINTASLPELMQVPGMLKWIAQDIITYRQQNGPFRSTEEILEIKGVIQSDYEAVRNYITIEDAEEVSLKKL